MTKLPRLALIFAAVLLVGLTLVRLAQSWTYDSHLDHVAGVWVALALDLKAGTFYRAASGPLGYGGTRFFPLYFCLHATGARLLGGWRLPGYALSAISVLALLGGVYYLLRRLGAGRWLAAAGVLTVLVGASVQDSLLGIREDGLAAALSVWGVALCAGAETSRRRMLAAAAFFTLAFATKETAFSGAGAVYLWFLVSKRFRLAWQFLAATAVGYGAVLAAMYFGSSGRAFEVLHLTLATGTGLASLLYSPVNMEQMMHGYLAEVVLLMLAAGAFVATSARRTCRLPSLLFLCTLAVTLVIFSSDGTAGNHLIELHMATVVMFAVWISELQLADPGVALLACVCLVTWLELLVQHRDVDAVPGRAQLQQIARAIGPTDKPILADNPMVPITAGQQPFLLDAFMFRVIQERTPGFVEPMWRMMGERRFAAVVLMDNPDSDEGRDTYSNSQFGEPFLAELRKCYKPAGAIGGQYLFLPRENDIPNSR